VVARRESHDAVLPLFRRELKEAVGRAPQLESAAGLQALALKPDAGAVDFALNQRRAFDKAADAVCSVEDVFPTEGGRFC
jgi:hypothetical protein